LLGWGAYKQQGLQVAFASITVFSLLVLVVVIMADARQNIAAFAFITGIFGVIILLYVVASSERRRDARQLAQDLAMLSAAPAAAVPRGTPQLASLFSHWDEWRHAINAWLVPASRGMRLCKGEAMFYEALRSFGA
jgi:hypothetical protein